MQLNSVDISYFKQQQLFSAWNTEINGWLVTTSVGKESGLLLAILQPT